MQDFCLGLMLATVISRLFFYTFWTVPLFAAAFPVFHRARSREREAKERGKRLRQLRDSFQAMASSMSTGFAMENAVTRTRQEMMKLWGEEAWISRLYRDMDRQLHSLHLPMEDCFEQFSEACDLKEAKQLSGLLRIAKRSGGNCAELFRMSAEQIAANLSVESEIQTSITQVRYEQRMMTFMPPGVLAYLQFSSYDMVALLYTTMAGRITMVICFGLYVAAVQLGNQISRIRVE